MRILAYLLLISCLSCNTRVTKDANKKPIVTDTFLGSEFDIDTTEELTCARGVATPVLKKSAFPNAVFQFGQDSSSAMERVKLKNGDSLIVVHGGCEYYVLTFRFQYEAPLSDSVNAAFAYRKAIESMRSVYSSLDVATDIKLGTNKLAECLKQHPWDLQFGEEIDFGGEDIRSYVTVDKAERLPNGKAAVEVSFSVGPL